MKKLLLIGIIFLVFFISLSSFAFACVQKGADLSTEVLLTKPEISYDLGKIGSLVDLTDNIAYKSHYDENVAVLVTEEIFELEKRLDVTIQIPLEPVKSMLRARAEGNVDYITSIQHSKAESLGWDINATIYKYSARDLMNIIFTKGNIEATLAVWASKIGEGTLVSAGEDTGVAIEITEEDSEGKEQYYVYNATSAWVPILISDSSIPEEEIRKEISQLLIAINFTDDKTIMEGVDFEEEWEFGDPIVNPDTFNFNEAMKTELLWLKDNSIVFGLTDSDINEVFSLAERGMAGFNNRIVFMDNKWQSYHNTENPLLKEGSGCKSLGFDVLLKALEIGMPELEPKVLPEAQITPEEAPTKNLLWVFIPIVGVIILLGILFIVIALRKRKEKMPLSSYPTVAE